MAKKGKGSSVSRKKKIGLFFLIFATMFFLFLSGIYIGKVSVLRQIKENKEKALNKTILQIYPKISVNLYPPEPEPKNFLGKATVYLPAVMKNDTGVYAKLTVYAYKGHGRIFIRTDNVLINDDTQDSIRKAALVASKLANKSLQDLDLYYVMSAPAVELEGPSAGAAITVATYAAIENKTLRNDVMMTGTINHDGSIGPAGMVLDKAKVAQSLNMSLFLIPLGTYKEYTYKEVKFCHVWGKLKFCDVELKPVKSGFTKLHIKIVEVGNITQALKYFLKS